MAGSNEISTGRRGVAVDVSTTDLTSLSGVRGVYVGVSGDIKADLVDGGVGLVFKAHPVGYALFQPSKIYSAGTTATNMIILY
jgi:hypothetical protein